MMSRMTTFFGGSTGTWLVERQWTVVGAPITSVPRLEVVSGTPMEVPNVSKWILRGMASHTRYTFKAETDLLQERQPILNRPEATCAALIPIRKNAAWWGLAQDQRREIVEARSRHISEGLRYLPAIARKLHHCRELCDDQPFDFLTWFEFSRIDQGAFEQFLQFLRSSEEWRYVDREVELRLLRG